MHEHAMGEGRYLRAGSAPFKIGSAFLIGLGFRGLKQRGSVPFKRWLLAPAALPYDRTQGEVCKSMYFKYLSNVGT